MTFIPLKLLKSIVQMKGGLLQLSIAPSHTVVFSVLGTVKLFWQKRHIHL